MADWHVGQLVVCIVTGPWYNDDNAVNYDGPRKGDILTIDSLWMEEEDGLTFTFVEFPGDTSGFVAFEADGEPNFRPVRKTSLDVFDIVRNKTPVKEDA